MPITPGTTFGSWELIHELGDSPFVSSVYLCRHVTDAHRKAVLKYYGNPLGDRSVTELRRMIDALKGRSCRNLARIEEANLSTLPAWVAMEYVPGESLDDRIYSRGSLGLREALQMAIQLGEALEFLHLQGCWHRDVKPENLRTGPQGELVLVDLGGCADLQRYSADDCPLGLETLRYGPPELADPMDIDAGRWDLYGLGACLWRALTGSVPYRLEGTAGIEVARKSRLLRAKLDTAALDPGPRYSQDLRDLIQELTVPHPPIRPLHVTEILGRLRGLMPALESPVRGWWLLCENGDSGELPFVLHPGDNLLGRGHGVDVNLGLAELDECFPSVSHRHALITIRNDSATICDLGSLNGSTVNGGDLSPGSTTALRPGDSVGVGKLKLRVRTAD